MLLRVSVGGDDLGIIVDSAFRLVFHPMFPGIFTVTNFDPRYSICDVVTSKL